MLVLVALFALMASLLGALALVALAPVAGRRASLRPSSAERTARRSGPRRAWTELPSDVPDPSWGAREPAVAVAA